MRSETPFKFLMKVAHPTGPLWKERLGTYAALSCFMALAGGDRSHRQLVEMGFLEALCTLFEDHFLEDIGPPTGPAADTDTAWGDRIPIFRTHNICTRKRHS